MNGRILNQMLIVAVALTVSGAGFTAHAVAGERHGKQNEKAKYHSSIQIADDDDESSEVREKEGDHEDHDAAETAKLQSLAKITRQQAIHAALLKVKGTLVNAELENEDGNVVYGVEVKTSSGIADVKVDAGNGKVLFVDRD